jgi:Ca2+-binding RTX toxin-like protein
MGTALGFLRVRTYDNRPRIWIETLENRRLFSVAVEQDSAVMLDELDRPVATAEVVDGVLTVVTGSGPDDVMIGSAKDDPEHLYVFVNYVRKYFARSGITAISVETGDGDDSYAVHNFGGLVNLPTTVNGGAGDDAFGGENEFNFVGDRIRNLGDGPFAPVHLIGGDGDDTLAGGIGDTVVEGGSGTNQMYGRKGLFTIADVPVESPPPFVGEEGEVFPSFPSDMISEVGALLPTSFDGAIVAVATVGEQPAAKPEPDASAPAGGDAVAAALAAPGIAGSAENSLLMSEGSLLGQRDGEIWG